MELRLDPSDAVVLVVRNLGPGDARNVIVEGRVDTGHYRRLRKLLVIPADGEQALAVPAGYDVSAGNSYLDVRLGWHDGEGVHPSEHRLATRRT